MKTIAEKQRELIEVYNSLDDQMMQYEFLLQLAGNAPVPDETEKNEHTKIRNCQTDFLVHHEERKWPFFSEGRQ